MNQYIFLSYPKNVNRETFSIRMEYSYPIYPTLLLSSVRRLSTRNPLIKVGETSSFFLISHYDRILIWTMHFFLLYCYLLYKEFIDNILSATKYTLIFKMVVKKEHPDSTNSFLILSYCWLYFLCSRCGVVTKFESCYTEGTRFSNPSAVKK